MKEKDREKAGKRAVTVPEVKLLVRKLPMRKTFLSIKFHPYKLLCEPRTLDLKLFFIT